MNQNTGKKELRERLRRERRQKFIASNFNIILKSPEIIAATTIASYISYDVEPSTVEINKAFLKAGKRLLLPRVKGEVLEWIEWDGDEKQLKVTKKFRCNRCSNCPSTSYRPTGLSSWSRWWFL